MTKHYERPVPARKRPEEIADYKAWAQFTRQVLGWADVTEDDPTVRTPFRAAAKLPPKTGSQLRTIAREQVAEARARRGESITKETGEHDDTRATAAATGYVEAGGRQSQGGPAEPTGTAAST